MRVSRRLGRIAAVTVPLIMSAGLSATGASASSAGSAVRQAPTSAYDFLSVQVGYVDSVHIKDADPFFPSPWQGDANVTFVGCNAHTVDTCPQRGHKDKRHDVYDAGAIKIVNNDTVSHTIGHTIVDIGGCQFHPWKGLNDSLGAGQTLILTETGGAPPAKCPVRGDEQANNFDTSEMPAGQICDSQGSGTPVISISVDGQSYNYYDFDQTLNTGGTDSHECHGGNEGRPWVDAGIPE